MARSRVVFAGLFAAGVVALACNTLTGLDGLRAVDGTDASAFVPEAGSVDAADAADAADVVEASPLSFDAEASVPIPPLTRRWARWPMPNPPDGGGANPTVWSVDDSGIATDPTTPLRWQLRPITVPLDGGAAFAQASCQSLPDAGTWLVPTRIELASLIDFTRVDAAIAPAFGAIPTDQPYWTSSPVYNVPGAYWSVDFSTGAVSAHGTPGYVLCVMPAQDAGP